MLMCSAVAPHISEIPNTQHIKCVDLDNQTEIVRMFVAYKPTPLTQIPNLCPSLRAVVYIQVLYSVELMVPLHTERQTKRQTDRRTGKHKETETENKPAPM